jgi:hypothetical protein
MHFEDYSGDVESSGHFLVSKGRTTAGEEFRSWHALVSTEGPVGSSCTVQWGAMSEFEVYLAVR